MIDFKDFDYLEYKDVDLYDNIAWYINYFCNHGNDTLYILKADKQAKPPFRFYRHSSQMNTIAYYVAYVYDIISDGKFLTKYSGDCDYFYIIKTGNTPPSNDSIKEAFYKMVNEFNIEQPPKTNDILK